MNIWKKIQDLLNQNQALYLLTVVESIGSAPGRRGFKMVVAENGELFGSIGGGMMEYNRVEKCKQLLSEGLEISSITRQIHKGDAHSSSGMICSGSQIIAFSPISSADLVTVNACISTQSTLQITQNGITLISNDSENKTLIISDDDWSYTEQLNQAQIVHVFGAGHVSVPTTEYLMRLGYCVKIYDNRFGINTFDENINVNSKEVVSYHDVLDNVVIEETDWVLIMTHKFTEDKLLLSQLLSLKLHYLGVLGSDNKIKILFDALLNQGFSTDDLKKVHAPIGLNINSQTTEEIAISIAAELIQFKNKH